jgi:hypothetical protein
MHQFDYDYRGNGMCKFARRLILGAALLVLVTIPSRPAIACSICLAGDPNFSEHGATVQQPGDFSMYIEFSGWEKRSGVIPGHHGDEGDEVHEDDEEDEEHQEEGDEHAEEAHGTPFEEADSQRLDLFLSWSPIDRLGLTLDIPFAFNDIDEHEEGETVSILDDGLGDISTSMSYVLWRNREILPSTWVEGRAFLKFPTGTSRQSTKGMRDKHIQTGTGSWDFGFGMAAVHKLEYTSLYASVFGRVNTKGSLDYEYGDVVLANLAALVPLGHATGTSWLQPFTPGLELNYRWAAKDVSDGSRFDDSGGSILYATPSLRVELPWFDGRKAPSVRAAVQIPLTSGWLNGFQIEDERWSVGFQFPF